MRSLLALVLFAGFAAAAPVPKALKKTSFNGRWELVESCLPDGIPFKSADLIWTIDGEDLAREILNTDDAIKIRHDKLIRVSSGTTCAVNYHIADFADKISTIYPSALERDGETLRFSFLDRESGPHPVDTKPSKTHHLFIFKRSEK